MDNHFISTDLSPELHQETVSSLRLSETGAWDVNFLKELFTNREQQQILSIPLSLRICDDMLIWVDDSRGFYTVKSGYNLLMKKVCFNSFSTHS